jgi:hypothetical protein
MDGQTVHGSGGRARFTSDMNGSRARVLLAWLLSLGAACASGPLPADSSRSEVRPAPEDDDLLATVPAEAEVVLLLDLAQLRRSPWTRELLVQGAAARAPASTRGFDEAADVDRLVLARLPGGSGDEASLTVAQGRFDRRRVFAAFREGRAAATSDSFRGCPLVSSGPEAVAFLTDRTLLSGPLSAVRGAIDASFGRARDVRGERWLRETRGPGRSSSAVELALRVTDPMRERIHDQLAEAESLERLGGRLELGPRLDLTLVGAADTAPRARALAVELEQAVSALRGRPSVAALGLGEVLAGVRIAVRGPQIAAELHLTEAQRDDIAARLSSAARLIARARAEAAPAQKGSP